MNIHNTIFKCSGCFAVFLVVLLFSGCRIRPEPEAPARDNIRTPVNYEYESNGRNLLPNSSFELLPTQWRGYEFWNGWDVSLHDAEKNKFTEKPLSMVLIKKAKFGSGVLRMDFPGIVASPVLNLPSGGTYTVSVYAKSLKSGNDTLRFVLVKTRYPYCLDDGKVVAETGVFPMTSSWKRIEKRLNIPGKGEIGKYQLLLIHSGKGGLVLDGIQLEVGKRATSWRPGAPAEMRLFMMHDNLRKPVISGHPVVLNFQLWAPGLAGKDVTVKYSMWSMTNIQVGKFTRKVKVSDAGFYQGRFRLKVKGNGVFRLKAEVDSPVKPVGAECPIVCLERMPGLSGKKIYQAFAGTSGIGNSRIKLAREIGFNWLRLAGNSGTVPATAWKQVEPEAGKFNFSGNRLGNMEMSFSVLGALGYPPVSAAECPLDRNSSGVVCYLPSLKAWSRYVYQTVKALKNERLRYWELWPAVPGGYTWKDTPENYYKLLRSTHEAAAAADSESRIIAVCQLPLENKNHRAFLIRLFSLGGLKYCDGLSVNFTIRKFSAETRESLENHCREITAIMRKYGKPVPVWINFYIVPELADLSSAKFAGGITRLTVAALAGEGRKVFFAPFGSSRENGIFMRKDDAGVENLITSAAPVLNNLTRLLNGAKWIKTLRYSTKLAAYVFQDASGQIAVLCPKYGQKVEFSLPARSGLIKRDMTGNPESGGMSGICIEYPVFLVSKGKTGLSNILVKGKVSSEPSSVENSLKRKFPLELEEARLMIDKGKLYLSLMLKNHGSKPVAPIIQILRLPWQIRLNNKSYTLIVDDIPPGSRKIIDLPLHGTEIPPKLTGNAGFMVAIGKKSKSFNIPVEVAYSKYWKYSKTAPMTDNYFTWQTKPFNAGSKWRIVSSSTWNHDGLIVNLQISSKVGTSFQTMEKPVSVDLFLDGDVRVDQHSDYYNRDDYHFRINLFPDGKNTWRQSSVSGKSYLQWFKVSSELVAEKLLVKIFIPKSAFEIKLGEKISRSLLEPGNIIGLGIRVKFPETSNNAAAEFSWGAEASSDADPSQLGIMLLMKEPVKKLKRLP